jgi:hypothetical protein
MITSVFDLPIGTVVFIPFQGYKHFGVVTGWNEVTHGSKAIGKVVRQTIQEFAAGQELHTQQPKELVDEDVVVQNSNRIAGQPYDIFWNNCEHVVHEIIGSDRESKQLRGTLLFLGSLFAIACLSK